MHEEAGGLEVGWCDGSPILSDASIIERCPVTGIYGRWEKKDVSSRKCDTTSVLHTQTEENNDVSIKSRLALKLLTSLRI